MQISAVVNKGKLINTKMNVAGSISATLDSNQGVNNIYEFDTYLKFPTLGNPNSIYIDKSENAVYRWDDVDIKYYCVARDYKEIDVINGNT